MFQTFVGKQEEGVCPGFVWQLGRLHKPLLNRRICINCSLDDLLSDLLVIMLIRFPSLPSPSFCPVAQFSFHSSSLPRHKTPKKAVELTNLPNETTILHHYHYYYYYYHSINRRRRIYSRVSRNGMAPIKSRFASSRSHFSTVERTRR